MDEFGSILDSYLDDEEIQNKLKQDIVNENSTKKNSKTKSNKFTKVISIVDFVSHYLGTDHDCTELKHQGLKSFNNPYVVGVSNNFALKNPDCVMRNEILVVIDAFGNPGSYINPHLLKNIESMEEYKYLLGLFDKIKLHSFENIINYYNLYKSIILRINELEKSYNNSCGLLKTLSKEKWLKQMREYASSIRETNEKWIEELLEVDNLIDYEANVLNDILLKKDKKKVKIN